MDNLLVEYGNINNPILLISSSSSENEHEEEKEKPIAMKEVPDHQNISFRKKKKPLSVQKKRLSFNIKSKRETKFKRKIPSPFKTKIAENLVNLSTVNAINKKRKYKQLKLLDNEKEKEDSCSEDEDENMDGSLMSLFKRAKRREEDPESIDVIIPKLQTVKKKTFMRSLASGNIKI